MTRVTDATSQCSLIQQAMYTATQSHRAVHASSPSRQYLNLKYKVVTGSLRGKGGSKLKQLLTKGAHTHTHTDTRRKMDRYK